MYIYIYTTDKTNDKANSPERPTLFWICGKHMWFHLDRRGCIQVEQLMVRK